MPTCMLKVSNLRYPSPSVGVLASTSCEGPSVTSVSTLLTDTLDQGVGYLGHVIQTAGAAGADQIAAIDDQCRYTHQAHGAHAGVSLVDLGLDTKGIQRFMDLIFADTVLREEACNAIGVIEAISLFMNSVENIGVCLFADTQRLGSEEHHGMGIPVTAHCGRHVNHFDIIVKRCGPLADTGLQVVAVRTAIPEDFSHLDLALFNLGLDGCGQAFIVLPLDEVGGSESGQAQAGHGKQEELEKAQRLGH